MFGPDSGITVLSNVHAGKFCVSWHRYAHGTPSTAMKDCEFLHVIFTSVYTFIAVYNYLMHATTVEHHFRIRYCLVQRKLC